MRLAHPRILILSAALACASALAETVTYNEVPATVAYKVASNNWSVLIRHPFRVIQLVGNNMKGELWFTPRNLKHGMRYALSLNIGTIPWPDKDLRQDVLGLVGADIQMSGTTMDILKWTDKEEGESILETHPNVQLSRRNLFPAVTIHSSQDGRVLHWTFSSEFPLTDVGIRVPALWGIPGEDKITVSGEVSFSPKD